MSLFNKKLEKKMEKTNPSVSQARCLTFA